MWPGDWYEEKVSKIEKEIQGMKDKVIIQPLAFAHAKLGALQSPGPSTFVPSNVYVQGSYDWKTRTGALSQSEVDKLAGKLLAGVPEDLGQKFKLQQQHEQSFRLQFTTSAGREQCWKFREHLVGSILKNEIKINEKSLFCPSV